MASPRKYKNVYTILEKVKKGEIKSYYKESDGGLFGRLNFYKKPDLIKPHLHYLDQSRLDYIMNAYMMDGQNINEVYNKFNKTVEFKKLEQDKKPDSHCL